jgi:hypothetical protein
MRGLGSGLMKPLSVSDAEVDFLIKHPLGLKCKRDVTASEVSKLPNKGYGLADTFD